MVITPDNNLIPYPDHHYQVQPYIHDNPIANQEAIGGQKPYRRHHSQIRAHAGHFDPHGNLYDFKLFLQYPAFDRVGLVVDIYA